MRALDLFAGTGWGVACQRLGISEDGVENMPEALATRKCAGMRTRWLDVRDVPDNAAAEYDLEIASPPCQSFSVSGKGAGRRALEDVLLGVKALAAGDPINRTTDDERTWLVLEPLRIALGGMPTYLAWEQVPAVLPVWEACAEVLREVGYSVWAGYLTAEMFGVPQTRKRAILIARRDGKEAAPPRPTHSRYYGRDPERLDPGVLPWVTMADALGWGATARPSATVSGGGTETGGAEPIAHLARFVAAQGDNWAYRRPATTVQGDPRIAAPGHRCMTPDCHSGREPESMFANATRISVREAAILQSYPPDFQFIGNQGKQHLQVGNAVPPLLAEAILRVFLSPATKNPSEGLP